MARSGNHISGQDKRANELKTALGALRRDVDGKHQPRILTFFSTTTPTTNTTGYLHPWFYAGVYETVAGRGIVMPFAGKLRNMYARVRTVGTGSGSLRLTVRRNNADTSLVVLFPVVAAGGNNRRDTVEFEAGDLISVSVYDVGSTTSPADIHVSLEAY